ncbi:MAG: type III-A CRISPR-associated protein Csm2 [Blastocatellia bacterium]|nr:type III-A CRISPR-associated protein Csm2 [Blastocatellia bacterium]MCS7158667.1 type III-A CRISPR-associated protein Csm2 [Blastocatellia bacterium]MCX7753175.1 type III-A CRISPR-associated protein Csm2 [Blastocatellia bacterium]MDW8255489.1 type III-A CRISPR-associated protein Csm2 [Acidobacteriota bacterium]
MTRANQPQRDRSSSSNQTPSREEVQRAIRDGGRALVDLAERLGPQLQKGRLTTSQIRNIYGMVKRMEIRGFDPNEFVLLKPKLAYAAARANEQGAQQLKDVLTWAIDEVGTDATKFARFVDFFEAILAYHQAAGGR